MSPRTMDRRRKLRCSLVIVGMVALIMVSAGAMRNWWLGRGISDQAAFLLLEPVTLAPGLHLLGGMAPSAVYVIETSEGLVLVDAGLDRDGGLAMRQMTRLGLDPARVKVVLLTHAHGDHSFGAMHFRQHFGAQIYAGRGDCAVLRAGGPGEALFTNFHSGEFDPQPTEVDVELSGGEVIERGEARFEVLATPGHTPGSVCYLLEREGLRALFTGDVILSLADEVTPSGAVSVRGPPLGTYPAYLPPRYRGSARDYLASLRKLRDLRLPDLLLPGHPRNDNTPQNPRIPPDRWWSLLDRGIREMEGLLARHEADGANFLDGNPKQILQGLYYLGDYEGQAVYCLRAAGKLFLFDAPGGPGLLPFLDSRLREAGVKPARPTAVLLTSCGPEATAGLKSLVIQTGCQVVAARPGVQMVRALCPPGTVIWSEDELGAAGCFPARAIPLGGRGVAPLAYELKLQGKAVLVPGRIPFKIDARTRKQRDRFLAEAGVNLKQYLQSLQRLRKLRPDIWLPAVPVEGQNANLYEEDWVDVLLDNEMAVLRG